LSQKNIALTCHVPKKTSITGDGFLLFQALSNLLQNAIDFAPENSAIAVRAQTDEKFLRLVVTDNGCGIPDYAEHRIFDKFFSLQRPDTGKKSTGLGLNFVKEVASLHQGAVKLENRNTGGVTATLSLPLKPEPVRP
jgi:two-component system sensor histidine kinase CreC